MERPCTNDKEEFPDDEVLGRYLGKVKETWDSFKVKGVRLWILGLRNRYKGSGFGIWGCGIQY